jgi:hypothetical protein
MVILNAKGRCWISIAQSFVCASYLPVVREDALKQAPVWYSTVECSDTEK